MHEHSQDAHGLPNKQTISDHDDQRINKDQDHQGNQEKAQAKYDRGYRLQKMN